MNGNSTVPLTSMPIQTVQHQTINGKYRVVFEKAASANKIDGFKIEVNSDSLFECTEHAKDLYQFALAEVEKNKPAATPTTTPAGK